MQNDNTGVLSESMEKSLLSRGDGGVTDNPETIRHLLGCDDQQAGQIR